LTTTINTFIHVLSSNNKNSNDGLNYWHGAKKLDAKPSWSGTTTIAGGNTRRKSVFDESNKNMNDDYDK
jgi:hypothetical protein